MREEEKLAHKRGREREGEGRGAFGYSGETLDGETVKTKTKWENKNKNKKQRTGNEGEKGKGKGETRRTTKLPSLPPPSPLFFCLLLSHTAPLNSSRVSISLHLYIHIYTLLRVLRRKGEKRILENKRFKKI